MVSQDNLESLARQTTESPLPSYLPSPSLSSSSFSYFLTYNQMNYYQEMQSTVTAQHSPGSLPNTKHSELIPKRRGVWAPTYVSTEQHYMPESTTTEGAPVAEGL